ncbi:hypothetical protein YpAngola_B0077 (plasmid) [Yersinia pestis Angola]|nr:hypothetical protein YpAngola_B0077 [Yersinia pestis Angola]
MGLALQGEIGIGETYQTGTGYAGLSAPIVNRVIVNIRWRLHAAMRH